MSKLGQFVQLPASFCLSLSQVVKTTKLTEPERLVQLQLLDLQLLLGSQCFLIILCLPNFFKPPFSFSFLTIPSIFCLFRFTEPTLYFTVKVEAVNGLLQTPVSNPPPLTSLPILFSFIYLWFMSLLPNDSCLLSQICPLYWFFVLVPCAFFRELNLVIVLFLVCLAWFCFVVLSNLCLSHFLWLPIFFGFDLSFSFSSQQVFLK